MKKYLAIVFLILGLFSLSWPQFSEKDIAKRSQWEKFLKTADIIKWEQPWSEHDAVNQPYLLTLKKNGRTAQAVWKNPCGGRGEFEENWEWEIAAYRLDKLLGLNMVPPTVPRRFQTEMGSCQLYIHHIMTIKEKAEKNISIPPRFVDQWNKATYLQRAWDNLIANTDRHQNQFLIGADWRMILIDHSRTFRTRKKYTRQLIFSENYDEGPRLMKMLPVHFYENLKNLTFESILDAADGTLDRDEIKAVLCRRDLIVKRIDERIARLGREKVLYE